MTTFQISVSKYKYKEAGPVTDGDDDGGGCSCVYVSQKLVPTFVEVFGVSYLV